jgi:hypothetical protein
MGIEGVSTIGTPTASGFLPPPRSLIGWTVGFLAGLVLVVVLCVIAIVVAAGELLGGSSSSPGLTAGTVAGVPTPFIPVYQEAERALGVNWFLLAAVHAQETDFNRHPATFTVNVAGCAGPMQICVGGRGGCTWCDPTVQGAHRKGRRPDSYPDRRAPHPSVYDTFDAVMGAAAVLRNKIGGRAIPDLDDTAHRALCGYYGACADPSANYAADVLARARAYAAGFRPTPGTDPEMPVTGGRFGWPVERGTVVTSPFCVVRSYERCHPGVDLGTPMGAPLFAVSAGRVSVVQSAAQSGGYGNFVCLDHGRALSSCYAHLSRFEVAVGEVVDAGQIVGRAGCTGRCTGPHLHFEIRRNGRVTCPAPYVGARATEWCNATWRSRA